ncbi:hypothetical protein BDY17DRAFT_55706 [Neohortaea acidophila]|uniref:SWIM-type domain-containing protein n=1 Tax=Neohortaea acidophila TaxID=245834 RepID=A0A6A6PFA9_9PEZI|nr:uncharacterized protein BDY17DRAFT_55706 [Neohortaea acidophila]KAF2478635.1 hypothetical protein BDY17DRAFT_55706 [Neohortaea acidophila]
MTSPPNPREIIASLISSIQSQDGESSAEQPANPLINQTPHLQNALLTLHVLFPNELLPALDLLDRNLITRLILNQAHPQHNQNEGPHTQAPSNPHPLPRHPPRTPYAVSQNPRPGELRPLPNLPHPNPASSPSPARLDNKQPQPPHHPHPPPHQSQNLDGQSPALHHPDPTPGSRFPASGFALGRRRADVYVVRSAQVLSSRGYRGVKYAQPAVACYEVRLEAWSCSCPAFAFAAFPATAAAIHTPGETNPDSRRQLPDSRREKWTFGGDLINLPTAAMPPVCKHLLACLLVEHSSLFAGAAEEREVGAEELAGWAAGWGD